MGGYVNTHHEKGATMFGLFHVVSLIWRAEHLTFCLLLSLAPGADANAHPRSTGPSLRFNPFGFAK